MLVGGIGELGECPDHLLKHLGEFGVFLVLPGLSELVETVVDGGVTPSTGPNWST